MVHSFIDHDVNGNERELIAHYDFTPEESETNFGAQVNINRIELRYKNLKRFDVMKYIDAAEIERAENEILENEIN